MIIMYYLTLENFWNMKMLFFLLICLKRGMHYNGKVPANK